MNEILEYSRRAHALQTASQDGTQRRGIDETLPHRGSFHVACLGLLQQMRVL
jgi:hypothetical protein